MMIPGASSHIPAAASALPGTVAIFAKTINTYLLDRDTDNNPDLGLLPLFNFFAPRVLLEKVYLKKHPEIATTEGIPPGALDVKYLVMPTAPILDEHSSKPLTELKRYTALKSIYEKEMEKFLKQRETITITTRIVAQTLSLDDQNALRLTLSLDFATLAIEEAATVTELGAAIKKAVEPNAETKAMLRTRFLVTHNAGDNPKPAIAQLSTAILQAAQSPYTKKSSEQEIEYATQTFNNDAPLAEAMRTYVLNTSEESRTFPNIAIAIQKAYEAASTVGTKTTRAAGYGASATATPTQLDALMTMMTAVLSAVAAGTANAATAQTKPLASPKPPKKPHPKSGQRRPYCWTHGRCSHLGAICLAKDIGHQDSATDANKMGGADKGPIYY